MNKKIMITIFMLIILFGSSLTYLTFKPKEYVFVHNGIELKEINACEEIWKYKNDTLIPCVTDEEEVFGVFNPHINYSKTPEENCEVWNGTFIGFNIKNKTRAIEKYEEIMPNCTLIKSEEINKEWLKESCIKINSKEYECKNIIVREI